MAIIKRSKDHGASIYHDGVQPNFDELAGDDRIRETYDPADWSAGDYTYSETDRALILTGTGETLWVWDGKAQGE